MVEKPELKIAADLSLPLEILTRRIGVLGMPGTGKTSTAVLLVEQARKLGIQVVVIDPTGAWWGIAHSRDGKRASGLDMVVLGGEHGVAPLSREAGHACARLVAQEGLSCVLDIDRPHFTSWAARTHFVADFLSLLYELCRSRILVVIDEAHRFAPQRVMDEEGDSTRSLGAVSDVVALGRRRGLDAILITQRSAKLHKDVLELCQVLIAHQLRGNNDRKQLQGWLDNAGGDVKKIMAAVGRLDRGHAFVSAPGYGVDDEYAILPKTTFDSSADAAATTELQPVVSKVDVEAIERLLAEQIEQAKADDPRELRKQIAALRKQLAEQPTPASVEVEVPVEVLTVPIEVEAALGKIGFALEEARASIESVESARPVVRPPAARPVGRGHETPSREVPVPVPGPAAQNGSGPKDARQKVLDALAWLEHVGISPASRLQTAMIADYHPRTPSFARSVRELNEEGLIEFPGAGQLELRDAGRAQAHAPTSTPTEDELRRMIFRQVGDFRARMLAEVLGDGELSRTELADRMGYHPRTPSFAEGIASLKALGLLRFPRAGVLAPTEVLFLR